MNPLDDLYIDDDFENHSFLTPNIDLIKNEYVILFGDANDTALNGSATEERNSKAQF